MYINYDMIITFNLGMNESNKISSNLRDKVLVADVF